VTPRTFIASISAIIAVGATPIFADIDPKNQNISLETILPVVTTKTRGIICVHLAGWPCDMAPIMDFANQHAIVIIEDCAQAHGAKYKGKSVGALGHVAAWSFCQDKIMSTGGEGGMLTTNEKAIWQAAWSYKDHGKSQEKVNQLAAEPNKDYRFKWLHESFGSNFRMTEMQAAIGNYQLSQLPEWTKTRALNAQAILTTCQDFGLFAPIPTADIQHAWYKCYAFVDHSQFNQGWHRDRLVNELNALGLPCFTGICPEVYREKAIINKQLAPKTPLKNAQSLGESSLMFLVHPTLDEAYRHFAKATLKQVLSCAIDIQVAANS
ncbi:MAG: DegT/DnrJ/EryC1/StrS aminotransferase family protein, partial [Cellvibrionales bacterium]|nr:DegT/DnrJ/EryC1/StrS aminotransferase family protein [Cellvibrionales bacterium]